MELALARLIGAGLTLVFEGFEEVAPPGAVENGLHLVVHIARHRPEVAANLTEGVVRDIWREWQQAKLPRDVAVTHLEALPQLMDRCRCSEGMMLGAVASIQIARRIGSAARPVSHSSRVAAAIVGRAIETGFLTSRGLNESIAYFFLDRLLARLMPDQQLFFDLRPLYRDYLYGGVWKGEQADAAAAPAIAAEPESASAQVPDADAPTEPAGTQSADDAAAAPATATPGPAVAAVALESQAAPEVSVDPQPARAEVEAAQQPAPLQPARPDAVNGSGQAATIARLAEDLSIPATVLEHLAEQVRDRFGRVGEGLLEDLAHGLGAVLAALAHPSDSDAAAAELKRHAGECIANCRFDAADALLGQSEDLHVRAAQQDLTAAHARLAEAAATRSSRAQLVELVGDFRRAARHYGIAARCLPDSDRVGRRSYLMRQAGALLAQGEHAGETSALSEAAVAYTEAGRLLAEQENPLEWASAHLDLGRLLMELGEREDRPDRYLAAAQHFKPAADVFSRLRQSVGWARAQLGLADALRAQGEVQGDIFTLSEAAFAYRAALGVATRDRLPGEWAAAQCRLATTLLRLDLEAREIGNHDEAIQSLRSLLSAGDGIVHGLSSPALATAAAQLAEALVAVSVARQEPWLGEEALTVVRRHYLGAAQRLSPAQRVGLDDAVGSLVRRLGEVREDADLIGEAAEFKLAALDQSLSVGSAEVSERIRGELTEMEAASVRIRGAGSEGAAA